MTKFLVFILLCQKFLPFLPMEGNSKYIMENENWRILRDTKNVKLVSINSEDPSFPSNLWSNEDGKGVNLLGKMLMFIRDTYIAHLKEKEVQDNNIVFREYLWKMQNSESSFNKFRPLINDEKIDNTLKPGTDWKSLINLSIKEYNDKVKKKGQYDRSFLGMAANKIGSVSNSIATSVATSVGII